MTFDKWWTPNKGCALELKIGETIHMTMAFIQSPCVNPSEIFRLTGQFLQNYVEPSASKLPVIIGDFWTDGTTHPSARLIHGDLATLKNRITSFLKNHGVNVSLSKWSSVPHIRTINMVKEPLTKQEVLSSNYEIKSYSYYCSSTESTTFKEVDILDRNNWVLEIV